MVEAMLNELGIKNRETRFTQPPKADSYAVWTEDIDADGADDVNLIWTSGYTIELYEYKPDKASETAIENYLDAIGIRYSKQSRYWIQSEQLYQVVYNFDITTKG